VTVNPEYIVQAHRLPAFRKVIEDADAVLIDGTGLAFALRLRGVRVSRTTGVDFIETLARFTAKEGLSLFLLGAGEEIAERTKAVLIKKNPDLFVAGTHSGSPKDIDFEKIKKLIHKAKPDILLVAYGSPAQDMWITLHQKELGVPVALGVGGAFDFISGTVSRAPRFLRAIGLEWLWRLILQPWRIKRIIDAVIVFPWLVLTRK
jgi:N-acetylglucosaminyldiphosphoundecaprenol N-acetyl-beta-D-mannosaminyltransferase